MTNYSDMKVTTVDATIDISESTTVSLAVDLGSKMILGFQMPAAFTGTALTFQGATSLTGTYQSVKDGAGNAVSVTVAQGEYIALDPDLQTNLRALQFVKLVSGSAEAADRTIEILTSLRQ